MRFSLRRFRKLHVAAWFGVLALGLQAYIPIHLSNDIVHAVNDALAANEWTLDAPPAAAVAMEEDGNQSHPGGHSHPTHRDCAIFLSSPGATAFVLPGLVEFQRPDVPPSSRAIAFGDPVLRTACPASYASRAPPVIA